MKNYEASQFCMRQVSETFVGTQLTQEDMDCVLHYINSNDNAENFIPGYMDGVIKWDIPLSLLPGVKSPVMEITDENKSLLVSEYRARREGEIPILCRYFKGMEKGTPINIEAVVYLRSQLEAEDEECLGVKGDLVVVLANRYSNEGLMDPNTMIRNHLGPEFGGSGHPLDRKDYLQSVEFWNTHALVE